MSERLSKKLLISKLPPKVDISIKKSSINAKNFTPTLWNQYYDKCYDLYFDNNTFRIYELGEGDPVLLFLHGGGFSALSWALLSKELRTLITCRCIAFDCRAHGDTKTADDTDLAAGTLVNDVKGIVENLFKDQTTPPIILIGHSMGGAIATRVASSGCLSTVIGLIVIDVVEGTALEALSSMQSFLKNRPPTFSSIEQAIQYCHKSGQIKNLESAKVSVVGQLKEISNTETPTQFESNKSSKTIRINEKDEDDDNDAFKSDDNFDNNDSKEIDEVATSTINMSQTKYEWRVDLTKTEPFWRGWFEGLSKMFLSVPAAKMLLLAGVDRLDKELTVGQMQGKFQMQLLQNCGHTVHEDNPEKVSEIIANFLKRNKFVT